MNTEHNVSAGELEAKLALKRSYLRAALAVAGGAHSSADATKVAGNEAAALKTEIAGLERVLGAAPITPKKPG